MYAQAPSGNHGGPLRRVKYVIIHYTASDSAASAIAWLRTPASKASAHVVIDQDGEVTQLVPFNTIAWHAGASAWLDDRQLNQCSIGIELVNPGPVASLGHGIYGTAKRRYTEDEVLHHDGRVWAKYPSAQIAAAAEVASQWFVPMLGHCDISPGRKLDPGPAFPWDAFREQVRQQHEPNPRTNPR